MARGHIRIQYQMVFIRLQATKSRDPFCGLKILNLRIMEPGRDQHVGIALRLDLIIGRVRQHVVVVRGNPGISPLAVLRSGKRNAVIKHGRHNVNEGYLGNDALIDFGRFIGNDAHQQTASRAARGK